MLSVNSELEMKRFGAEIGARLRGGEVLELIGDVGAGKTTFVKGLGEGLIVDDDVQSPSFTISRVYGARDGLELHHYDFYRLTDAGIMRYELAESVDDKKAITVIEWADTAKDVLPKTRLTLTFLYTPEGEGREVQFTSPSELSYLTEEN